MFNKKWIYFLTVLFCNVWILNAQTPQDLQRMKSEYEKFQKNQNRNPLLDDDSFKEGLTTNTPTNRNLFPYISSTDLDSIEAVSRYKAQNFTDNNLIPNIQTKNSTNYNLKENEKWIRVAWQNEKVILMPGDSIIIKRSPGTINVSGEVYNPGLIEYQKGKSLRYYLDSAGGVTNNGDKDKIIVIYANGVVRPKKFLQAPRIRDGATIIVNQKEQVDSINFMELATNTLSIISTTVTILVLSQQISSTSN